MTVDGSARLTTAQKDEKRRRFRRRAWFCRLFGHRFCDPHRGWPVHFFLPSAEGRMGLPDRSPIGICECGARWERSDPLRSRA